MARILLHLVKPGTARTLRRAGYKIERHSARPGQQTVSVEPDIDLAIFNFDPSSREWCIALRKRHAFLSVLAIANNQNEAEEALKAGATDVILRPLRSAILVARVKTLIKLDRVSKELEERRELREGGAGGSGGANVIAANDFLERLIESSPDPIICSDVEGNVNIFNRAAEELLEYRPLEVRHLTTSDLFADPVEYRKVLHAISTSQHHRIEGYRTRLRAKSGEHIPTLLSAATVTNAEGEAVATVGVYRDTRESDSLASRLRSATDRLISTEKRAAAVALAGATAHELNQPLTSVMGIIELLLATDVDDNQVKRLERAYTQLERMAEIVRDLSNVSTYKTTQYVDGVKILDLNLPRESDKQ